VGSEIVSKALIVAGAIALLLGPMLQAVAELRIYEDLLQKSGLSQASKDSLSLLRIGMFGRIPWWARLTGLYIFWLPKWAVDVVRQTLVVIASYARVVSFLQGRSAESPEERARINVALSKTRNWFLIGMGSAAVLAGSVIDLVNTLSK
jgi:hypothetical protein